MTEIDDLRKRFRRMPAPPEEASDGTEGHTYADVDINGMLPGGQMEALKQAAIELGWGKDIKVVWGNGHYNIITGESAFRLPYRHINGKAVVTVPGWSDEVKQHIAERDKDKVVPAFTVYDDIIDPDKPVDQAAVLAWYEDTLKSRLAKKALVPASMMRNQDDLRVWALKEAVAAGWPDGTKIEVDRDIFKDESTITLSAPKQISYITVVHNDDVEVEVEIPPYTEGVKIATASTKMREGSLYGPDGFASGTMIGTAAVSSIAATVSFMTRVPAVAILDPAEYPPPPSKHLKLTKAGRVTPVELERMARRGMRKAGWPSAAIVFVSWVDVDDTPGTVAWPKLTVRDGSEKEREFPILIELIDYGAREETVVKVPTYAAHPAFGPDPIKRIVVVHTEAKPEVVRAPRKRKFVMELAMDYIIDKDGGVTKT